MSEGEAKELAVPQSTSQEAEEEVVCPHIRLGIVAPRLILGVLVEAEDGIRAETTQRDEENSGKRAEHGVGQLAEVQATTEGQAHVEAAAHETCQQSYTDTLGEVKFLNGSTLFLFAQRGALHAACHANDGDAQKGDSHSQHDAEGQRSKGIGLGEEDVEKDGAHDGAQTGTRAKGNGLAEGYAQVAHGEAEGEASHTPEGSEEDGHANVEAIIGRKQFAQAMTFGHGQKRAQEGQDEPSKDALDDPKALPTPILDLLDGHITA